MKVSKAELKSIINKLTNEIDSHFDDEIELGDLDYFWDFDLDEMINISEEPSSFCLRQMSDDWRELQRLLPRDGVPISYDLIRLAGLLTLIKRHSLGKW